MGNLGIPIYGLPRGYVLNLQVEQKLSKVWKPSFNLNKNNKMKNSIIVIFFIVSVQMTLKGQTGLHYYTTPCSIAFDILKLDDGFLVTGRSACDFMLLKTDENGDSIWQKIYPLEAIEFGESCTFWSLFAMPDGNFLATGLSENGVGFIMKFTGTGDHRLDQSPAL